MKVEFLSVMMVTLGVMGLTLGLIFHTEVVALGLSLIGIMGLGYLAISDLILKKF